MANTPISQEAQELLDAYRKALDIEKDYNSTDGEKITMHQVSGKIAFLYEKIRNTVDYKEENLLRKNAIERILKRRITTEKNEYDVAKFLLYELIRARYLPNKQIPQERIEDIKFIIEKYTFLLNKIPDHSSEPAKNESIFDWIIGIASCEIEEKLAPREKEDAIVEFAQKIMEKKIAISEDITIKPELEKELIYVAVLKNLTKSDLDMIRYKLFIMKHSDWIIAPSEDKFSKMALIITSIAAEIENVINHRYSENFSRAVKKNIAYFTILEEVAANHPKEMEYIFSHHYHIEDSIKETCVKKYRKAKAKIGRYAVKSTAYIFITKVVLAIIIEVPFDKIFIGYINYFALLINILFPPILMALVVITIKVPSRKNTDLIVAGIEEMIYDKYTTPPFAIKRTASRNSLFSNVFKVLYFIIFAISFGAIILILEKIGFSSISTALFLFFLSVVSYFGVKIRQGARELMVAQQREGIGNFLIDLFSMPIIQVGKWLSTELSNINIFVFILDFIIEAPFKTFVEIFEEWIYYVKEEKDKIE